MQIYSKFLLFLIFLFVLPTTIVFAASFQGIGVPSGSAHYPAGISSNCRMVGGSATANWIWADGAYSNLSGVPAAFTDISNDGSTIIGYSVFSPTNGFYKIVNAVSQFVSPLSQNDRIFAKSISADGSKIVGETRNGVAWAYENGGYTTLSIPAGYIFGDARAISSDGAVIAGQVYGNGINSTALWKSSGVEVLPNPTNETYSMSWAISGDGSTVVGQYSSNNPYPCIWRNGAIETIPLLANVTSAIATGVSFDGSVVFGNGGGVAFVWDATKGTRSLKDFLKDDYGLNLTGWNLQTISATDASGNIITGYGINPQGKGELWIATIPEPATMTLLGLGSLLLRRRK